MKLTDHRLTDLLAAFRSPQPTPGGGSAAALSSAVGASLLAMVAALPKPQTPTAEDAERLAAAGARLTDLSDRLAALIDRDSAAYDGVVAAFRLPKDSEAEKTARSAAIQEALRAASEAPLDVMRASAGALEQAAVVAAYGNRNASSDVRVGLEMLGAGLRGAALNVDANLGSIKDAAFVAAARNETRSLSVAAERETAAAAARLAEGEIR